MWDEGRLSDLIYRFNLHEPRDHLFHSTMPPRSWVLPPKQRFPTEQEPATIYIPRVFQAWERRMAFAHEVAHVMLEHQGSLPLISLLDWVDDRQENEAWAGAARLLMNPYRFLYGYSIEELAAEAEIDVRLAERHPWFESRYRPHLNEFPGSAVPQRR
jgi:hypothetical protein